jgi:uncharacterized protein YbjQ (UPF0145 family)
VQKHLEAAVTALKSGDTHGYAKNLQRFSESAIKGDASDADLVTAIELAAVHPDKTSEWLDLRLRHLARFHAEAMPQAAALVAERDEAEGKGAPRKVRRLLLCTTPSVPGREIVNVVSIVSGQCVMSRQVFSDIGSDTKNVFGGRLRGIEKAVERARVAAQDALESAARVLGADAVVGIDTSVQTVTDKAQLVLMVGTAVTLGSIATPETSSPAAWAAQDSNLTA